MMYIDCWEILEIDPDSDKKTIKIAYSKRLKKTRPDEDPEGFKILHNAYQEALSAIKESKPNTTEAFVPSSVKDQSAQAPTPAFSEWQHQQNYDQYEQFIHQLEDDNTEQQETFSTSVEDELTVHKAEDEQQDQHPIILDNNKEEPESPQTLITFDNTVATDEEHAGKNEIAAISSEQLATDWDKLFTQAVKLIEAKKQGNKVKEWEFIEDIPSIVDIEFRRHAGNKLFAMVGKANSISLDYNVLTVKAPVLNYLNDFFNWEYHWQYLENNLGETIIEGIFPYLHSVDTTTSYIGYQYRPLFFRRIGAFVIDTVIIAAAVYLLSLLIVIFQVDQDKDSSTLNILIVIMVAAYFLLIIPLLESSKKQASYGKYYFSLIVVNKKHERLKWSHAISRAVISIFILLLGRYLAIVNIFMGNITGYLLQDYFSSTRVIREPKSR